MELSRLFFAGLARPEEQLAAIRDYIRQMEDARITLCAIQDRFQQLKRQQLPPESDWPQILRFQGYTIEYGIAAAAFEIGWYKQLLSELEEQP